MSMQTRLLAVLFLTVATATVGVVPTAEASHPVDAKVTGKVTDVREGDTIYIAGKPYKVQANSPAARMVGTVQVGTVVDLVLNGPVGDAKARVVAIVPHERT